jgi:glyoxylate reductase
MLTSFKRSAQTAWTALGEVAELVESTATNRADFIQECKDGKMDGVVAIYRTIGSLDQTGLVDGDLLNALPSSLRYIAHCGMSSSGFEHSRNFLLN